MPTIQLKSSDDLIIEVDVKAAKLSVLIKRMLEDLSNDAVDGEVIPLPNVPGHVLRKFVEWANHHRDDPEPSESDENEKIPEWDAEFLAILDLGTLFDLMTAANFLDAKRLTSVIAATVADMIAGKTPEAIRKFFNIPNDFSEDEESN